MQYQINVLAGSHQAASPVWKPHSQGHTLKCPASVCGSFSPVWTEEVVNSVAAD